MFDSVMQAIADHPHLGAAILFLLCGMGLPLPEELVLIASGYVCAKFPDRATVPWMMVWCAGAILGGDLMPFVLGRVFGARMLRLRWLRITVTRRRLASFDRWFRHRGDLVIFIARFLAGIRMVAFFTAGTMKMRWSRFLMLDGLGIVIIVPVLIWVGYHGAGVIDVVIERVQAVERGLFWSVCGVTVLLASWIWMWRRRRRARAVRTPAETFVEPRLPVQRAEAAGQQPVANATAGSAPPAPIAPPATRAAPGSAPPEPLT